MRKVVSPAESVRSVELVEFFTELARLLVDAGVSHTQFTQISEIAFLRAAALGARFANSKINQSTVAAMTGINRTRVRELLKGDLQEFAIAENRVDRLVTAWVSEPELLTSSGQPRKLRLSGGKGTFAWLARRHGGDVPARALVRELSRRGLIRKKGDFVSLSVTARRTRESKRINQIARALTSVLSLPVPGTHAQSLRVASLEVAHPPTTAIGRVILHKRISKSLRAFMAEVEAAGAAVAVEAPLKGANGKRLAKTGVFLISQD